MDCSPWGHKELDTTERLSTRAQQVCGPFSTFWPLPIVQDFILTQPPNFRAQLSSKTGNQAELEGMSKQSTRSKVEFTKFGLFSVGKALRPRG